MKIEDLVLNREYLCNWGDGDIQVLVFKEMHTYDEQDEAEFAIMGEYDHYIFNNEQVARRISEIKVTSTTPVPHIHAKEMIAFANGHEIECYNAYDNGWVKVLNPIWHVRNKYRVKKDNSDKIAEKERIVSLINIHIDNLIIQKDKELATIQELQS